MSYLIAARLSSVRCALVVGTLSLAWLWVIGYPGYPLIPALFLTLLSTWFFISFLCGLFLSGLCVAGLILDREWDELYYDVPALLAVLYCGLGLIDLVV